METIHAITLGIIQGLTEFLPVSSSGHLVIMQHLLGFKEPELLFDICLHVGTLLAVCIVLKDEIISILKTLISIPYMKNVSYVDLYKSESNFRYAVLIIIATIPTGILGVCFHSIVDKLFGSVELVGFMLIVTGLILITTKYTAKGDKDILQMGIKDALIIGTVQGLAILPGISRSGSTIAIALILGTDRKIAGHFSFLLSIPAILGAVVLETDLTMWQDNISLGAIFIGTLAAFCIGYFALKVLLSVVRHGFFYYFAPYCFLIGAIAIMLN